jgi:hypothetical protein
VEASHWPSARMVGVVLVRLRQSVWIRQRWSAGCVRGSAIPVDSRLVLGLGWVVRMCGTCNLACRVVGASCCLTTEVGCLCLGYLIRRVSDRRRVLSYLVLLTASSELRGI